MKALKTFARLLLYVKVSIIVCTYTVDMYEHFCETADSILGQTHDNIELIVIIDGTSEVYNRAIDDYGNYDDVRIECNKKNIGLLRSRNRGAEIASGDVVAFIDDDAIADQKWVEELVSVYNQHDVLAAGGKMTPAWVAGNPSYLPEEFYWLVGVTHRGFADGPGEVRNTFGSNISFDRETFLNLDGFESNVGGRKGDANLQGGETELCARLRSEYGSGVYYNPDAEVAHKVFAYRTDPLWLLNRAFWQGYSKRGMQVLVPESTTEEYDFLGQLLTESIPQRVHETVLNPSLWKVLQLGMLFSLITSVGFGFLYGIIRWR
jgi:glycosyltransferase involved in cell wall biosynthesis